jgi:Rieske 2Fe-2S family protein
MRASPLPREALELVLQPIEHARSLPGDAFTSDDVFAFERQKVLALGWVCLGHASDVAHPGSWMLAELGGDGVLVMRGEDLELRAFYNLCVHRGVPLVGDHAGRCAKLVCRYHGWTYGTSGQLLEAPHTPPGFVRAEHSLRPLRLSEWQGFVFATRMRTAPPLEAWMGEIPPWLAKNDLRLVKRGRSTRTEVSANWKVLVANFQESHHFTRVHPELERLTPTASAGTFLGEGAWLGGTMEIHAETVSRSGSLSGRPRLYPEADGRRVFDAMMFPTWLTSLQPDYFLSYRLEPLSAERTRVIADVYFHPAAKEDTFADVLELWDTVNAQDRSICEAQQRGVASAGFLPGPYTTVDEGVHAFEQLVARQHVASLAKEPRT